MKEEDRRAYFRDLDTLKRDIINIGENPDYSGLEVLKREFK